MDNIMSSSFGTHSTTPWSNVRRGVDRNTQQLPPRPSSPSPEPQGTTPGVATSLTAPHSPLPIPIPASDRYTLDAEPEKIKLATTTTATTTLAAADSSRLRSIARYGSFLPKALACSSPILSAPYSSEGNSSETTGGTTSLSTAQHHTSSTTAANTATAGVSAVSLGAVAGLHGVALFRVTRPYAPLLVLSLATSSTISSTNGGGSTILATNNITNSISGMGIGGLLPDCGGIGGGGGTMHHQDHIVSSLCFQPHKNYHNPSQSLYLAAARGTGVLVWDVSGHSLSPLWGRLGALGGSIGVGGDNHHPDMITSLAWYSSGGEGTNPLSTSCCLAATTPNAACIWDLRDPSSRSSLFKPCLRFGTTTSTSINGARRPSTSTASATPLSSLNIQLAFSDNHECAILDRVGIVRIYDTRMVTSRIIPSTCASTNGTGASTNVSGGPVLTIQAHSHAGVGLAHFSTASSSSNGQANNASSSWVTWGLDSPESDAVVRVWSVGQGRSREGGIASDVVGAGVATSPGSDESGLTDPSVDRSSKNVALSPSKASGYRLIGQCTTRNLACARVCPSPVNDALITIGFDESNKLNWRLDVWKLNNNRNAPTCLESVAAFRGGEAADKCEVPHLMNDFRFGSLCAAELALTAQVRSVGSPKRSSKGSLLLDEPHLLLCTLSDTGYIMTHAIPDVMSTTDPPSVANKDLDSDLLLAPSTTRTLPVVSSQTVRVFPPEKDGPVHDAAKAWAGKHQQQQLQPQSRDISLPVLVPRPISDGGGGDSWPPKESSRDTMFGNSNASPPDGAPLLFDIEFPVYSMAGEVPIGGVTGLIPESSLPASMEVVEENENSTDDNARDAAMLMERIDTERIPCPRLCGGTFGPGNAGFAIFNNGDVRKMWKWWEKTEPSRSATAVPGMIGVEPLRVEDEASRAIKRDCPRTFKDLTDMKIAAREAQWGDQDESEVSSTVFHAPGPSFFEDASEGSSETEEDDSLDPADKDIYESYFGQSHRPLVEVSPTSRDAPESQTTEKKSADQFGPASDVLSPFVCLTHQFDNLALNNQSIDLAMGLKIGKITVAKPDSFANVFQESTGVTNQGLIGVASRVEDLASIPSYVKGASGLPSYRFLVASSQMQQHIPRISSDPILPGHATHNAGLATHNVKGLGSSEEDTERGVHGGEYGVRPNMQESMVFLRKLFTHQHEGGGVPNHFSPPDGPLLPNSRSDPMVSKLVSKAGNAGNARSKRKALLPAQPIAPRKPVGLYTLRASDRFAGIKSELIEIEQICLHNARVCNALGEKGKQSVWDLLAKVVASRCNDTGTTFEGPSAIGGGALGTKLVNSLLNYYESLGDVQMLSTIVCVLRCRHRDPWTSHQWSLLPVGQDDKFDLYIRRYADLLFAWGLLTVRAEVNKHLSSLPANNPSGIESLPQDVDKNHIAHVFTCPRCSKETMFDTNFCRSCQDYAFRCIICDNAVRGLFTACDSCGHGGHVLHLRQWFSSHDECPTGCGCVCMANSSNTSTGHDPASLLREDGAGAFTTMMPASQRTAAAEAFF